MFKKVLVANRGEIAVRILRACEERGLRTVAVYSDADRSALHVRYANEAYPIGPAPARESYLRIDKIIDVARKAGADAIHPGYGFLAERAEFAQACEEAGITFVGPSPDAIAAMGDKVSARRVAMKAGVPIVPGSDPASSLRDEEVAAEAERVGYPIMIKAAAGGGGKGMRKVSAAEELASSLAAARRESKAAFNDDSVYIEKAIEGARHIEIQVLADKHGNAIHLGERECSIQRRHQKLIEECPSVFVDPDLRMRMGALAVRMTQAACYSSAGTLEFLMDKDHNFYFLEMNTRLQVEHPVTEMVTGVDIVKEQLAIAAGRRLRWRQEDIHWRGWAIECRIVAEDPYNNFSPSSGRITALAEPNGPGVRVENGIYEGFVVPMFYDSLMAKLVAWGETRAEAILRMRRALNEFRISGVKSSIPFHQQLLDSTQFMWGTFDTSFMNTFSMRDPGLDTRRDEQAREVAAVIAAYLAHQRGQQVVKIGSTPNGNRTPSWRQAGRVGGWRR